MKITSLQNEKVKFWVSLSEKKNRDKSGCFLIEGDHLINEAKKLGLIMETISTDSSDADYLVTDGIMKKICNQKSWSSNAAVVRMLKEENVSGNILVLDGLQDPGNLGTIIRSSVAFGFTTIILSDTSVDLYNPKTIRATEGMIFNINVLRRNLKEFLPELKKMGYQIYGTDVINGKTPDTLPKKNIALIIGSEGSGMDSNLKPLCDGFIYIPINKACESLNAGVAASILMYEVSHD